MFCPANCRNLKAEVERLKAQHSPLLSPVRLFVTSPSGNSKDALDEPKNEELLERELEILSLREELRASEQQLQTHRGQYMDAERQWQQRLQDSSRAAALALERCEKTGIVVRVRGGGDGEGEGGPYLVNLCDDPQLSGSLQYAIAEGVTSLGGKSADLNLRGLASSQVHW